MEKEKCCNEECACEECTCGEECNCDSENCECEGCHDGCCCDDDCNCEDECNCIEDITEQVKNLENELLKSKAEFINYRKRLDEEHSKFIKF